MKKKWLAAGGAAVFCLSAAVAIWLNEPVITQVAGKTITENVNKKLNGSLSYTDLHLSLSGQVVMDKPVIKDQAGRVVLEGKAIRAILNPGKILTSLSDGASLGALETLEVESPVLHVWQNDDGAWNVTKLIKENKNSSDPGFHGQVHLQDGCVRAKLPDNTLVIANEVQGNLDLTDYPTLVVDASAVLDGKKVTAHGRYASMRRYDFVISAGAVKASYAAPFVPAATDVTIRSGVVNNLRLHVADDQHGVFLSGSADLTGAELNAYGVAVTDLSGHVALARDAVTVTNVQGQANGQAFRVDGEVVTSGNTPVFDLMLDVPQANLAAFADFLPLAVSGNVAFQGKLWGTAKDLSAQGKVSLSELTYAGYALDTARADIFYQDDNLSLKNLEAQAYGATLQGEGEYATKTGDYTAQAEVKNLALSQVPGLDVDVLGTVSASLRASGNGNDGTIRASGQAEAKDLSYRGLNLQQASGDFAYDGHLVQLTNGQATVDQGHLQVSGTYDVDKQDPDFTFTGQNLPLDLASSFVSLPLSGSVDLAGHVTGTEPAWEVALSAKNGTIKGMPFDSIDGSAKGSGNFVSVPSLVWRYQDGVHYLHGQADLAGRTLQGSLTTKHMRLEDILPVLGKSDLALTGWADNTVNVSGSLDNPQATGSFTLSSGSCAGYLYKNVSADYQLSDGRVYFRQGDISSYTASLSFDGSVGEQLDLNLKGKQLDIARLLPDNKVPRSGIFDLSAHLGGTLQNPTASGSLQAANLVINHMPIHDVHGDFTYGNKLFQVQNLHFAQLGGTYAGQLNYTVDTGQLWGRANVTNGDIAGLIKVAALPLQHIEGKLNGTLDLAGTAENPTLAMHGQISQGSLSGQALDPSAIDVEMKNGVVKVKQLALKMGDSLLAAQGDYALHGPVKLSVAARSFPAKVLLDVLNQQQVAVDGPVNFAANLKGTGDDLEADVSAELASGTTINGVSISGAYALLNIRDGLITVQQASGSRDPYKVSAHGTIPVSALSGGRGAQSMDLTLKLDNASLDILTFLTPYVENATGPIQGAVKVSGTLDAPRLDGDISVNQGSVTFKETKYPLANINAHLLFKGTSATLTGSASMDKKKKNPGSVTLDGQASWQGRELTDYRLGATLDALRLSCPYYDGPLTGEIVVTPGSGGRPKVSGLMEIANTTLDVPLAFSDSSMMPDIETDFTLTLGDKVHLYNPILYDLWVGGSATFKGTLAHPRPVGRFEATRGTVHYLDTDFIISKARADFSRYDSFLPYIDAEGMSRVGQYNVLLTLRGQADNMDLMLRSDPPLTRQQIVSLITLRNSDGQLQSSINRRDVDQLVSSGIRMTLNSLGLTHSLEHALSLDMLTVTSGSLDLNERNTDIDKNYYNIEMGKYLSNDFMLTAAFGLNHGDNRFGMRYDLGSKFSANAWTTDDSHFIGGLYKYTF